MGKEPINQLQHRNARAAGEPEDPGQEVGLMYRDQAGDLKPSVYLLQHYSRFIVSGARGQSADQHLDQSASPCCCRAAPLAVYALSWFSKRSWVWRSADIETVIMILIILHGDDLVNPLIRGTSRDTTHPARIGEVCE